MIYRLSVFLTIVYLILIVFLSPFNSALAMASDKSLPISEEQQDSFQARSPKMKDHEGLSRISADIGIGDLLGALIDIMFAADQEQPAQVIEERKIPSNRPPQVNLDAKDIDIRDLLRALAKKGNLNLILDDSVQGRITVRLQDMAIGKAIELVLRANGFAFEKVDDYIIAADPNELRNLLPTVTKVITLQHTTTGEMKQNLIGLMSDESSIKTDTRTNSLIITDIPAIVEELEKMIAILDVEVIGESKQEIITKIFPLEQADAATLQTSLSEFLSDVGQMQAESKSNALIVVDIPSVIEQLTQIIHEVDSRITDRITETPQKVNVITRVFKLNYIDANSLQETLGNIISAQGKIQTFVRQKDSIVPTAKQETSSFSRGSARARAGAGELEKKWSDTLIVTDISAVVQQIEDLIRQLDTKTPQVMIEARITELSMSDDSQLGVDWQAIHSRGELSAKFPSAEAIGMKLQIGTLSPGDFKDITAILQLLQRKGKAKLLSNPKIITLDNELAEIVVADRFPVRTTYETELRATTAYEYINIGIILTVTPHISENGYIIIDVQPEVDFIKETPAEGPPVISSRAAHARVRIKDGETLVIGGLVKEEETDVVRRVPILGRIPLLGMLFRNTTKETQKTDLMVFITPHIYRSDDKP